MWVLRKAVYLNNCVICIKVHICISNLINPNINKGHLFLLTSETWEGKNVLYQTLLLYLLLSVLLFCAVCCIWFSVLFCCFVFCVNSWLLWTVFYESHIPASSFHHFKKISLFVSAVVGCPHSLFWCSVTLSTFSVINMVKTFFFCSDLWCLL